MRYDFSKLGVFSRFCQNCRDLRCLFLLHCASSPNNILNDITMMQRYLSPNMIHGSLNRKNRFYTATVLAVLRSFFGCVNKPYGLGINLKQKISSDSDRQFPQVHQIKVLKQVTNKNKQGFILLFLFDFLF